MRLDPQLDLYLHSPAAMAQACRLAADTARRNPWETPERAEARARHYEAQAQQWDTHHQGESSDAP